VRSVFAPLARSFPILLLCFCLLFSSSLILLYRNEIERKRKRKNAKEMEKQCDPQDLKNHGRINGSIPCGGAEQRPCDDSQHE
jgi:hypothetical protein